MPWTTKPLAQVARRLGGGTPSRDNASFWGGDLPWFTVADLDDVEDIQRLTKSRENITQVGLEHSAAKLIPAGAVVFSSRVVVGKVGIAENDLATNQDFSSFIPVQGLQRDFLAYFLIKTKYDLREHQRGATIKGVTTQILDALQVPLPQPDEQRRIVERIKACMARIDEIEGLRSETKKMAATLELAAFHDALVAGIEQHGWPMGTLGEVALSFRYGTSAKAHSDEIGTPVLRMGNIVNGYFDYSNLKYIELQERELDKYRLKMGDILINRTNSLELVGKAAMFDREGGEWAYASYLVCVDVDRSRVMPEFATAVINSRMGRDFVAATARRAIGMVNINAKEMARFPMPLPPLKDQEAIVELLRTVRSSAKNLRSDLEEPGVGHLRSAVLRKAFAGEL